MPLKNYTTTVKVEKTVLGIQKMLANAGARRIMQEYDEKGNVVALSFQLDLNGNLLSFTLPSDFKPVHELLKKQNIPSKNKTEEQARRTAWRIVKDWIDAQLAIVETQMVTVPEVFLPYANMKDGKTVYQHYMMEPGQLLLN